MEGRIERKREAALFESVVRLVNTWRRSLHKALQNQQRGGEEYNHSIQRLDLCALIGIGLIPTKSIQERRNPEETLLVALVGSSLLQEDRALE